MALKARKYKERYRIVEGEGAGSSRRVAYAGEYYGYPEDASQARQRAARAAVFVGLYWLTALAYLRTGRATGRCMYALMPFLLGLLPGAYMAMGLAAMFRAPRRMTVVQRENGPGRLTRAALGCGIFSTAGCAGCAVFLSLNGLWPSAWHEPLLTTLAAVAAWMAFSRGRADYRALEQVGKGA